MLANNVEGNIVGKPQPQNHTAVQEEDQHGIGTSIACYIAKLLYTVIVYKDCLTAFIHSITHKLF